MRDHVLSASGKYEEVLVRNLPASTDRCLFASASYVANPPPPAKFVLHIPRSTVTWKSIGYASLATCAVLNGASANEVITEP